MKINHENRNNIGGTQIIDHFSCPLTGELLHITAAYHQMTVELYPDFLDILFDNFNSGEPDYNIIVKKTIVTFFDKYPIYKNKYIMYMLIFYMIKLIRCGRINYAPYKRVFYDMIANKDFLLEPAYKDAPPDFKLFLSQLRNLRTPKNATQMQFYHNCFLVSNRLDNYTYALDEDTQHGEVALPYFKMMWLIVWLARNVKQLLEDGSLVLTVTGSIRIDAYTQELIDANKEGRVVDRPSRIN